MIFISIAKKHIFKNRIKASYFFNSKLKDQHLLLVFYVSLLPKFLLFIFSFFYS